jgi:Leucine-rich repeat (LRR) protein
MELPQSLSNFTNLTQLDFGGNRLEIAAPEYMYLSTCAS